MKFLRYLFLLLSLPVFSQDLYLPSASPSAELLLEQLASDHIIPVNSLIRPYSRKVVSDLLEEALKNNAITPRQRKDIEFALLNYSTESDSAKAGSSFRLFGFGHRFGKTGNPGIRFSVVPVISQEYWSAGVNKTEIGAGALGYLGKHWSMALSYRQGFQSEILASPYMLTPEPGQIYRKYSDGSAGYHEWTGQLMYSWKWGSFGVIKDRFAWGNHVHGSNIISAKAPSFGRIQLKVKPAKWIEFTWFHGMLKSGVTDSTEYAEGQTVYRQKYMAANFLTVTPWKYLDISLGNSAIYGDHLQAAFFIPVLFYKSVDHTLYPEPGATGGTNSQMFLDISSSQIRHLKLHMTLFIDEFKMSRVRTPDENNFLSWKAGFSLRDFPFRNIALMVEGTRTLPLVYQHNVELTTYTSSSYNMGNYLRDNAQEIFIGLTWSPWHRVRFDLSFNFAERGDDYQYVEQQDPASLPVLQNITFTHNSYSFRANWDLSPNSLLFLNAGYFSNSGYRDYIPESFYGENFLISAGFNAGF